MNTVSSSASPMMSALITKPERERGIYTHGLVQNCNIVGG